VDVGQEGHDGGRGHAPEQAELGRLLDAVGQVPAGVGEGQHLRAAALRLQEEGGEVGGVQRVPHRARHPPAARGDHGAGVALEGVAERVVHGEEEPALPAAAQDGVGRAARERVAVEGPVDAVGRAGAACQVRHRGGGVDHQPLLLPRHALDRQRHAAVGDVHDDVHAVVVVPAPRQGRAHVGAVLVVARQHLHRPAEDGAAEVGHRHPRRLDRARPGQVGEEAGLVVQHADPDHAVGEQRPRRRPRDQRRKQREPEHPGTSPVLHAHT
jgi:hypothetical protein